MQLLDTDETYEQYLMRINMANAEIAATSGVFAVVFSKSEVATMCQSYSHFKQLYAARLLAKIQEFKEKGRDDRILARIMFCDQCIRHIEEKKK